MEYRWFNTKQKRIKTLFLSSQHSSNILNESNKKKPETILYYNATKGGVDCVDERVGKYSVKYTSKRCHVLVWCNILNLTYYMLLSCTQMYFQIIIKTKPQEKVVSV